MSEHAFPPQAPPALSLAVVARTDVQSGAPASYLCLTPAGEAAWTLDPLDATPFASLREAARMALRLPASVRAYGLPRRLELSAIH